jgi:hypothetical protein
MCKQQHSLRAVLESPELPWPQRLCAFITLLVIDVNITVCIRINLRSNIVL